MTESTRYIFVSGGVVSGLGKGVAAASIAFLLKARGFAVVPVKCDMFVNLDAGTLHPGRGEVFVTEDGLQADPGLGHYERFLNQDMGRLNYVTTGQIFEAVINRERELYYEGKCVEVVPHIPEEIIARLTDAAKDADFVIVELGGTVGEYQGEVFLEATRTLAKRLPGRTAHVHVAYFPYLASLGELKSKPAQLSIRKLNECGILPDFVIARSASTVDAPRFTTLCQNSNLEAEQVVLVPDFRSIYEVPLHLEDTGLVKNLLAKLGLSIAPHARLFEWARRAYRLVISEPTPLRIGVIHARKQDGVPPAYTAVSLAEALHHAGAALAVDAELFWLAAHTLISPPQRDSQLAGLDGLVVTSYDDQQDLEGAAAAAGYARKHSLPLLATGQGLHAALIEFARNAAGLENAGSQELNPDCAEPVIRLLTVGGWAGLDESCRTNSFGGPIYAGKLAFRTAAGTRLRALYEDEHASERQRQRSGIDNAYRERFEAAGLVCSGETENGKLVTAVELPDHPFFLGVQFQPEYRSRFEQPHPLIVGFVEACRQHRDPEKASQTTAGPPLSLPACAGEVLVL